MCGWKQDPGIPLIGNCKKQGKKLTLFYQEAETRNFTTDMDLKKAATRFTEMTRIPYAETGCFSNIVLDYIGENAALSAFYQYKPSFEGIKQAIEDRRRYPYQRDSLVAALKDQYTSVDAPAEVLRNIDSLLSDDTFTITTAHQPNIFTGPLYFIYKILHAIKLAETLAAEFPSCKFVPVFFMGSEDADLDELGHMVVDGKRYEWKTSQTGAVGRMKVDKAFIALIEELNGQIGIHAHGAEIVALFRNAYTIGKTIQQATFELVNALFGRYGLVVLIPDSKPLKKLFSPVIEKELKDQFSHKAVATTIEVLGKQYKVQAGGRDINLFYLSDNKRERIELKDGRYKIASQELQFTQEEILLELNDHPERFSPNVILRGVMQEMILPNVAFIGGGGEIAYWLELKNVFEAVEVPFPVLVLRNSFLILRQSQAAILTELGFSFHDLFSDTNALLNQLTKRDSANQLSLSSEIGELNLFYQQLHETTAAVDPTLADHVNNLQAKALKRITELEKKMLRAEKKKFEAEKRKIQKLRDSLFPKGSLQERVENISGLYAKHGNTIIDKLLQHSLALEQQFTVILV